MLIFSQSKMEIKVNTFVNKNPEPYLKKVLSSNKFLTAVHKKEH